MNPTNKRPPAAGGIAQSRLAVARPKAGVPAQGVNRPTAPPVYRPQPQKVAQAKTAIAPGKIGASVQSAVRPVAPPVYRPQARPEGVQAKMAGSSRVNDRTVAPPVYGPRPVPTVLKKEKIGSQQAGRGQQVNKPAAPSAYHPGAGRLASNHETASRHEQLPGRAKAPFSPRGGVAQGQVQAKMTPGAQPPTRDVTGGLVQRGTAKTARGVPQARAWGQRPSTVQLAEQRVGMREKIAEKLPQINTSQMANNWDALVLAPPANVQPDARPEKDDFWPFTVTAGNKDFNCHISFHGLFNLAHVTVFTNKGKINYWYEVGKGGTISDPDKKVLDKKGSEMISNLPPEIKTAVVALLRAVYNGTC
jgi:hypothetical protein